MHHHFWPENPKPNSLKNRACACFVMAKSYETNLDFSLNIPKPNLVLHSFSEGGSNPIYPELVEWNKANFKRGLAKMEMLDNPHQSVKLVLSEQKPALSTVEGSNGSMAKMQKVIKYTIFKTKWGYFGLAGTENGLLRTCLPLNKPEKVKSRLLINLDAPRFEKQFFKIVQDQITAYFACPACPERSRGKRSRRKGAYVNFTDIPIVLDGLSDFCSSVLTTCRGIRFGRVITYSDLAKKIGRPKAARAVGSALAKNPLPLIIPCHRIIRSDGQPRLRVARFGGRRKVGGFSAPGGINTKAKLLKHEQKAIRKPKIK